MNYIQKKNLEVYDVLPPFFYVKANVWHEITDRNYQKWYLPYTIDSLIALKDHFVSLRGEAEWLATVVKCKRAEISAEYKIHNSGVFEWNGHAFQADNESKMNIMAINGRILAANAMPADWVGGWPSVDNTPVPIPDVATWDLFYEAMIVTGEAVYVKNKTLKDSVEAIAADTNKTVDQRVDEIQQIVW